MLTDRKRMCPKFAVGRSDNTGALADLGGESRTSQTLRYPLFPDWRAPPMPD